MYIHATAKEPVGMLFTKCEIPRDGFMKVPSWVAASNERDQSYHIFNPR